MLFTIVRIFEIAAILGSVSSAFYYLLCLWSSATFLREQREALEGGDASAALPSVAFPPVSILKPLKGVDPDIYESFRSHCLQEYPEYELIFGVSDANDPAIEAVKKLQQEFSSRPIQLVVCRERLGANVKVSNLEQMLASARYEHMLVNDSDIRVEPDYLRRVMTPLNEARVGMVTCLYRGIAAPTLGSRLECLGISTDFSGGLLTARQLEGGMHFGLGSTMAFRRRDLAGIGGFKAIVDYLADDYELGRRIAELGLEVKLSEVVVETHLPAYGFQEFLTHQLRWARGIRDSRGGGYAGLILTFGLMWGMLCVVFAGGAGWSWGMLAGVAALRLAAAIMSGRFVLQDRQLFRNLWLLPLRDLLAVGVWAASFAGHTVTWRGDRFALKNGRLIRTSD